MATGFGDWRNTLEFKKVISEIVTTEINKQRPNTRLAEVVSIDKDTRTLGVVFAGETNEVKVPYTSIAPANVGQYVRIGGTTHDRYVEDVIGQNDTDRRLEFAEGQINSLMTTTVGSEWEDEDSDNLGGLLEDFFTGLGGSGNPQELLDMIGGKIGATVEEAKDRFEALVQGAFGNIDPSRLAEVPWANLSQITPNLLQNAGFDSAISIEDEAIWTWDEAVGRSTPGSARTTGDGTLKTLTSNEIKCSPGQKFDIGGWLKWSGVTASAGPAFQLAAVRYLNGAAQSSTVMEAVSSPAANQNDWQYLGDVFTVPAGTDAVRLRLIVGANVSAGTVWWDDISIQKTGAIPQSAVNNLVDDLGKFPILGDLAETLTGIEDGDLTDIGTLMIQLRTILSGGNPGALIPALAGANLGSTLTQIGQIFNQEVVTPINDTVQGIKDWFADLVGWKSVKADDITTADSTANYAQTIAESTVLNLLSNKPLSVSLDPTATPVFEWQVMSVPTGQNISTQTITNTIARMSKVRFRLDQIINTVSFLCSKTNTPSLYITIWLYNRDTNIWNRIYATGADYGSLVSSNLTRITIQFSAQGYPVSAGDVFCIQFRQAGSGNFTFASRNFPVAPALGFVPGALGGARNPTSDPDPATITNAVMDSYNDGNTVWAEFGSNLGQLALPRYYYITFDNGSWMDWVRNGDEDGRLSIVSGRVEYEGGDDGARFATYGKQTLSDDMEIQFNLPSMTSATQPLNYLALFSDNTANVASNGSFLAGINRNKIQLGYGSTVVKTLNGTFNPGSYKLRYSSSYNTFYIEVWNATTQVWDVREYWTDSSYVIPKGIGRRYGSIGMSRLLYTNSGVIDEVHIRDSAAA